MRFVYFRHYITIRYIDLYLRLTQNKDGISPVPINADILFSGVNTYLLAILAETLISYLSVDLCEQCIIGTSADILAGVDMCSSLSVEDVACEDILTVSALCAETLSVGVTAVLCGAHTFFMSEILHAYD